MKKIFLFIAVLTFAFSINAQENDTMYVMKNGEIIARYNVNTDVDSVVFTPPAPPSDAKTFTDARDGNVYKYVAIGDQIWMAENLRYLPQVDDEYAGDEPRFYIYDYHGTDVEEAKATIYYKEYGVLYNWTAATGGLESNEVPSGIQGICPEGWHMPSSAEWDVLANALGGGLTTSGGKLKEVGTTHWDAPNTGATDEFGFGARAGGSKGAMGGFFDLKKFSYWWTTTPPVEGAPSKWTVFLWHNKAKFDANHYDRGLGFSVRCIQD